MRIAIVNDMVIAVEAMRQVLLKSRGHEVAWVARDGAEAVERCAQDTPDLVLMDLIMPKMGGVEATRRIMAQTPCAIVVVTASVNRNSSKVFEAMGAGALDAVSTPTLGGPAALNGTDALLGKIETIHRLIGERPIVSARREPNAPPAPKAGHRAHLVAIGASAGGPAALGAVLSRLPTDFPAAIIVVQHVDSQFTENLANWLSHEGRLRVQIAKEGDHPEPGKVLLAGMGDHLVFTSPTQLGYRAEPEDSLYRPSIDVFFKSVVRYWHGEVTGALLTGMGRDGAEGLKALREAGHHTLAQDEQTSAVFGMPKAAIEMNAASEILPLQAIGPRIAQLATHKTE